MSILRHPRTGSARWAVGLLAALGVDPRIEVRSWLGPARIRRGGAARKLANLLVDSAWLDIGLPAVARSTRRDAMLMPVNVTSARLEVPQVVTIHDVNFLLQPSSYDRAYAAYARRMFRASARRAAAITTVSEYSRAQIAEHLDIDPARIHVIYPGLDPVATDVASVSPMERPYALFVGATEPHKDVPTLVQAWRELEDVELDLAIVGQPGRDHDRVLAAAARAGGRVHVIGRVTQPALDRWFAHAQLFVFPSLAEGFGFPPLEAMQRGIPVIACTSTSLPEVLGGGALYHQPGASDEVAALVRELRSNPGLSMALVEEGRKVTARYSWNTAADAITDLLTAVTTSRDAWVGM